MRQQFTVAAGRLRGQAFEHVTQLGIRVMPVHACRVDQAHDRGGALARAQAASEQPVIPTDRDGSDQVFDAIVVRCQAAIVEVAGQRCPAPEAVVDRPGSRRSRWHLLALRQQPGVQGIGNGLALVLADPSSLLVVQVSDLTLDLVQAGEQRQGLLTHGALVVGQQLVELRRACARQPASVTPLANRAL